MAETQNYKLYTTEPSDNPKFKEFREELCGNNNSNMVKIDRALFSLQSRSVDAVLYADAWRGTPNVQSVQIDGLTAEQNGSISISNLAVQDEKEAAMNASLYVVAQTDGELTIGVEGVLPTIDIPVTIIILG